MRTPLKARQLGPLTAGISRFLGVPQDSAARAAEIQAGIRHRHEAKKTTLFRKANTASADIVVLDGMMADISADLAHGRRGLRVLRDRTSGMPELAHRVGLPLIGVVLLILVGDFVLLRPAFAWASQAGDFVLGPFKLGRDGGAAATSLILFVLATIAGRSFRIAASRTHDKTAGGQPVTVHTDIAPENATIDLTDTTPLDALPGSRDRKVHARPGAYSDASRWVHLLSGVVTFSIGIVLCIVCGKLRQHSEALISGAAQVMPNAGLLQTTPSTAATSASMLTFVLLSAALFIAATAVAFIGSAPLAAALHAQQRMVRKLENTLKKMCKKRERKQANLRTTHRQIDELGIRTGLYEDATAVIHAPGSVNPTIPYKDLPGLTAHDISGLYDPTTDASKALAPSSDLPLTPKKPTNAAENATPSEIVGQDDTVVNINDVRRDDNDGAEAVR